jgi:3-hydroxybutyrate dehydrogenase
MDLAGRTALVTGGGRGIGAACARALAAAGARVVVTGRSEGDLAAVAAELGGVALRADLTDRADTDRMLGELARAVPRVDILVNNAGIAESAPLERTDDAMWDRIMELNATATFRVTRALVPAMVAATWGRVVNIASNAGVSGYGYTAAYCASKHAVVGMTRALAIDLGRTGVTINAVCPGWVETDMARGAIDRIAASTKRSAADARGALEHMSPQRRLIQPDEVAHAVVNLCAEGARGIHGQTIVIDGGAVLK